MIKSRFRLVTIFAAVALISLCPGVVLVGFIANSIENSTKIDLENGQVVISIISFVLALFLGFVAYKTYEDERASRLKQRADDLYRSMIKTSMDYYKDKSKIVEFEKFNEKMIIYRTYAMEELFIYAKSILPKSAMKHREFCSHDGILWLYTIDHHLKCREFGNIGKYLSQYGRLYNHEFVKFVEDKKRRKNIKNKYLVASSIPNHWE